MDDGMKRLSIACLTLFLTTSSVAWAIAVGMIYSPPGAAKDLCAKIADARSSAFCVEIAKR